MDNQPTASTGKTIKNLYFYLVSFVALMILVFSTSDIINIALKTWVFTQADKNIYYSIPMVCADLTTTTVAVRPGPDNTITTMPKEQCEKQNEINAKQQEASRLAQKQMSVVRDISLIVVAIPLFIFHWRILRRKDENL
ncbi:MAG TPA: hypothetical protein VLK22_00175 [Candidatus Udaeobacter sp.]|nr:hypothetical protein [Candidatus Udaeobacter sp.]